MAIYSKPKEGKRKNGVTGYKPYSHYNKEGYISMEFGGCARNKLSLVGKEAQTDKLNRLLSRGKYKIKIKN